MNVNMSNYAEKHRALDVQQKYFLAFREAFLDTVAQMKVDDYAIDAWRAILNAGIGYMIGTANNHLPGVRGNR